MSGDVIPQHKIESLGLGLKSRSLSHGLGLCIGVEEKVLHFFETSYNLCSNVEINQLTIV